MLVTFTTDTYANVTMFGDIALKMLKMMGTVKLYSARFWRKIFPQPLIG